MPEKAVFLDKDGTLIPDIPYNVDSSLITLADQAGDSLRRLVANGYKLVMITNQSGVARGLFPEDALEAVFRKINHLLEPELVAIDAFYYCPHHPDGKIEKYALHCECRKPKAGLLKRAAIEHNLDLTGSWMIGDILNDVEAGHVAGCRSMLINNGNETEWDLTNSARVPDYRVSGFKEAADIIITPSTSHE